MKTYYSVAIGKSTDMQYHPAPDNTCGHKHQSIEAAEACQKKLLNYRREKGTNSLICDAKWYNSYIVRKSETASSGWRKISDPEVN